MRISQGYLLVLLLASLSASCTSDCPTTEFYGPAYRQCTKLYDIFEAALIENRENLFKLHDTLFPSSSSEPPYAVVTFLIRDEPEVQTCWTSSVLLRSVDPIILASLQLRLLNILLQTVGVSELTTTPNSILGGYGVQLPIELNVSLTQSDFNRHFNIINAVLQDLASWLKVYASTQRSRSFWTAADFKYQGYSCNMYSLVTLLPVLISIDMLIVLLTTIALIRAVPKFYWKVASHVERGNQWYSFFWAASFVASVCSIALWVCELTKVIPIFLPYKGIILFIMCFLILLDILIAVCIPKSAEFPIPCIAYLLSFPFCCRRSRNLRSKWIQTLALSSFFIFAEFVALSALSTILWAFVYPIQTLSIIALLAAAIFCVTALIALLIRNIGQINCSRSCTGQLACSRRCRDSCYSSFLQLLLIPMVIIFLAIMILSSYVYIKFITSGIATNQVGGFIVSFLPFLILTIIGWFVTKGNFFKQTPRQENDYTRDRSQPVPPTEQTPLNA